MIPIYPIIAQLLLAVAAVAQINPSAAQTPGQPVKPSYSLHADYLLGADDQLTVTVVDLETDFTDKTFTINGSGDVTLPHAGRIHAAGLTTAALESEIRTRLTRVLKDPQVVVSVAVFGTHPVSILGSVNTPGMRDIQNGKTLFEVLSLAGGLRPDAGYLIHITRDARFGILPLPGAQMDPAGRVSTATIKVKDIMDASNPAENIPIMPGDTVSVPKADIVYAVGSVTKPGGFPLNEHETLSALQVVSLAEGLSRTAAPDKAKILRSTEGASARIEIPVNLKLLLAGKSGDIPLQAGDILFIPNSNAKSVGYKTIDAIVGTAGAALIYAH